MKNTHFIRWCMMFILVSIFTLAITVSAEALPSIVATAPSGTLSTQNITLSATTNVAATCKFDTVDVTYGSMLGTFAGNGTTHTLTTTLADGDYTYYVRCADNETMNTSAIIAFAVDTTPPSIITTAPTGEQIAKLVVLTVTTQAEATCKYDATATTFANMEHSFAESDGTTHTDTLRTLEQKSYSFNVACRDVAQNEITSTIAFSINLRPTASINVQSNSPLDAGTYKVEVLTSENMIDPPTLQYDYNDDTTKKVISLTGAGSLWYGYLLIKEDSPNKVGTFYFSGKDETGVSGTEITDGMHFLVDTGAPPAPDDIEATQTDKKRIRIDWHYDGEDIQEFHVFRSTNPGVDYVDYYADASKEYYVDNNVETYQEYYYRVAAVDDAGNEGPLSDEAIGIAVSSTSKEEEVIEERSVLTPAQLKKVNATLDVIQRDLFDVDEQIQLLEKEEDPDKLFVINELDLVKQAKNAYRNIENVQFEILDLQKNDAISTTDLEKILDKAETNAFKYKTDVPLLVSVRGSTSYKEVFDEAALDIAIREATLDEVTDTEQLTTYKEAVIAFQEAFTIDVQTVIAKISYLNADVDDDVTIIKKTLVADQPQQVQVIEVIPKDVARRASDVVFSSEPEVLNEDPVVSWEFKDMSTTSYTYRVAQTLDLVTTKQVKTIPLIPVNVYFAEEEERDNDITGNVAQESTLQLNYGNAIIILGIFVVLGLVVYYTFFMRTEEQYEQAVETGKKTLQPSKIVQKVTSFIKKEPKKHDVLPRKEKLPDTSDQEQVWAQFTHVVTLANLYANAMQWEKAHVYYVDALNQYQLLAGESVEAEDAVKELNKIYSKLHLHNILEEGHRYVDKQNVIGLRKTLVDLQDMYGHLEMGIANTSLGKHYDATQSYLLTALSTLEEGMEAPNRDYRVHF